MPGLQNIRRSGLYEGIHPIYMGNSVVMATALGSQANIVGFSHVLLDCSPIDTLGTPFGQTQSIPMGPNVGGVTSGVGNGVVNWSRIFFILGQPTQQSGTLKFLQGGNCPHAWMSTPSMLMAPFVVNG